MLVIRTGRIEFLSKTGAQTLPLLLWFPDQVLHSCWVGMSGYRAHYAGGEHELRTLQVALECAIRDTEFGRGVEINATLHLADSNGDDAFNGWVDYVLFVDVTPTVGGPTVGGPADLDVVAR